jgi:hypothetical protein
MQSQDQSPPATVLTDTDFFGNLVEVTPRRPSIDYSTSMVPSTTSSSSSSIGSMGGNASFIDHDGHLRQGMINTGIASAFNPQERRSSIEFVKEAQQFMQKSSSGTNNTNSNNNLVSENYQRSDAEQQNPNAPSYGYSDNTARNTEGYLGNGAPKVYVDNAGKIHTGKLVATVNQIADRIAPKQPTEQRLEQELNTTYPVNTQQDDSGRIHTDSTVDTSQLGDKRPATVPNPKHTDGLPITTNSEPKLEPNPFAQSNVIPREYHIHDDYGVSENPTVGGGLTSFQRRSIDQAYNMNSNHPVRKKKRSSSVTYVDSKGFKHQGFDAKLTKFKEKLFRRGKSTKKDNTTNVDQDREVSSSS